MNGCLYRMYIHTGGKSIIVCLVTNKIQIILKPIKLLKKRKKEREKFKENG